ncbi:MAG: LPS export ABC transporter permease LptG [Gammaproteobacteria bacterium]
MNVITGYIVKEILKGSLIALVFVLTLFNLFTFSDELKSLGQGDYGLKQIFSYLALTSPRVFYELVPSSALLGSLFILGAMGNNRELIAMQSAGLSVPRIITAVMLAGAVLVFLSILVGEFVAPLTERKAQLIKVTAKHQDVLKQTRYGIWLREDNKFINVRKVEDNGHLADISIYEIDGNGRLQYSVHAEQAVYLGQQQWKLLNISRSEISDTQISSSFNKEELLKSSIAPDILKIAVVSPDNLSLNDLALYIDFLKKNHQKSHIFEMAYWGRLVNPFITFVMLLVSAPFVIGVKRGVSVGARMMIGVVIGMGFNILDRMVGHLGLIYELNPALMAVAPSLTVFVAALFALKRSIY